MQTGLLLACVLIVGILTYAVDHINHKRQKKEGVSVFPAIRNMVLAASLAAIVAYVSRSSAHAGAPVMGPTDVDRLDPGIAQLMQQMVSVDRVPRRPAYVGE